MVSPVFVSALYYGINKGISDILGEGSKVLSRKISMEMINFLEDVGYLNNIKDKEDLIKLFTKDFGLAEDLKIEENDDEVIFIVINPTLDLFIKKMKTVPQVCPFIHLLSLPYSKLFNVKLMFKDVIIEGNKIKLIFKKVIV
ncbi:hypothetical protein [Methanocaldococcus sp.]